MNRDSREGSLLRAVGIWGLAANIVNLTVGGGIFRLPAAAATALGAAAPVAYLVCALLMGLIVLCFAEAGSRVSLTGGLYAYIEVAFGPLAGFMTGVLLWAAMTAATAAIASFFADALSALVPAFGVEPTRSIMLVCLLAGFAGLNIAGARGASRFNIAITVAKLLPLFFLVAIGAGVVHRANVAWTTTPVATDVARASAVLMFAFFGVESALVPSGEVRDPSRTVPRAILVAMITVTVLYLAIQIVAQGVLGGALAGSKAPLADAAAAVIGAPGRTIVLVGSAIATFGYVSGMSLSVPRMLFAFGRDGFLPGAVAAVHPRFQTPYVAIATQTSIVVALAVSGSFEKLIIVADGAMLLVYAACCLAVLLLRRRDVRQAATPFRVPFGPLVPLLGVATIVWMLTSLSGQEWRAVLVAIGVAVVVYLASLPARRAASAAVESA
jgi:basic amino acid/polyamine antiporter, APA family